MKTHYNGFQIQTGDMITLSKGIYATRYKIVKVIDAFTVLITEINPCGEHLFQSYDTCDFISDKKAPIIYKTDTSYLQAIV